MIPKRSKIHFIGICGTAMASVAGAMKDRGFVVTGSDQNVYPPMSTFLASKQIEVMNGYAERNLAHQPDLVVIGNALSRGNPEVEAVLDAKRRYTSQAALLAETLDQAIGKFLDNDKSPTRTLGGIVRLTGTNRPAGARASSTSSSRPRA